MTKSNEGTLVICRNMISTNIWFVRFRKIILNVEIPSSSPLTLTRPLLMFSIVHLQIVLVRDEVRLSPPKFTCYCLAITRYLKLGSRSSLAHDRNMVMAPVASSGLVAPLDP